MKPTVPRGKIDWDTLEKIEEDPAEWKEYDARRRSLEEKYGDKKVFNFINQQYRYNEAQKRPDRTAGNLYYNTAGEIEARDVSARRELSAEERRAKKPAGANDDTVFANWEGNGSAYDIREIGGEKVAWVDKDITKSKPKNVSMEKYVKQYIENMISQTGTYLGTLPDSGMRVYAETQNRTPKSRYGLADEYVRSSYTRWIKDNSKNKFRAKMKAAGVLDDLVSIATDRAWEKTKHAQNKDAQYGVYNYSSTFAFPVYDSKGELSNVRTYECQLVILNASDGKKYLYDVIRIKENTAKANDFLLAERQRVANKATRQGDVYNNSISRSAENDNTKFSQREQTDKDRDKRQAEISQEIERLKKTREERLNANPNYLAAAEQRRYASTFTERVAASKAIKAAAAEVDTAEIDSQIEALRRESDTLRDAEKREYEAVMAVAITVTTKNHYHVHRVLMPDGSKFTFDVGKKKTESTMYSAVNTGEETKDSVYESKISQPAGEFKGKASYAEERRDKNTGAKIRPGMDEEERARVLEGKRIQAAEYNPKNKVTAEEIRRLEGMYVSRAGTIFKRIAEKCGVFRTYRNEDVDIEFNYTRRGFNESKHKQKERGGTAEDFGKILTALPQIIEGAVEIETQTDRYRGTVKQDDRLKEMHVLLGALRDGTDVIPVQLEIKEYLPESRQANKLYVSVTLTTKEAGITLGLHASQNETLSASPPASVIRISDILKIVNDPNGKLVSKITR